MLRLLRLFSLVFLVCLGLFSPSGPVPARTEEDVPFKTSSEAIAAWVGQEPIFVSEVDRLVSRTVGKQALSPIARAVLQAQALEEIIARSLVLAAAERKGEGPKPWEIDAALAELEKKLTHQKRSLQDYLQSEKLDLATLRRQLAWELYWPQRLAQQMSQERVEAHFQAHRKHYDGTEVLVSHILFPYPPRADKEAQNRLLAEAERVRQEIVSGRLSFAEAARRYSQAPTGPQGGQIGWIARHGAMVESFAKAAFALDPGQVSPPVLTPFGVHLIRCEAIRPGTKRLEEVRSEVEKDLAWEILQQMAAQERRWTPVRYTGAVGYWDPKTRQLVLP